MTREKVHELLMVAASVIGKALDQGMNSVIIRPIPSWNVGEHGLVDVLGMVHRLRKAAEELDEEMADEYEPKYRELVQALDLDNQGLSEGRILERAREMWAAEVEQGEIERALEGKDAVGNGELALRVRGVVKRHEQAGRELKAVGDMLRGKRIVEQLERPADLPTVDGRPCIVLPRCFKCGGLTWLDAEDPEATWLSCDVCDVRWEVDTLSNDPTAGVGTAVAMRKPSGGGESAQGTVPVRIAVAIAKSGDWYACGWPERKPDGEWFGSIPMDMAQVAIENLVEDLGGEQHVLPLSVHWIEARVPLPVEGTIEGEVTGEAKGAKVQ
jgi:hypothetical protein